MPPASWLYWAVFLAHASPSLAWVAPSQYATARHPQGLDPRRAAVVTAASLWAFTVQVAPVKNDAEIREAAAFFADAFFNVRSQDGSIQPEVRGPRRSACADNTLYRRSASQSKW